MFTYDRKNMIDISLNILSSILLDNLLNIL